MGEKLPFSITLGGPDQPGLLARICGILAEHECELSDSRLSQLVGEVVGIMVVYAPPDKDWETLSAAFDELRETGLAIAVREPPDDGWVSHKTPFTKGYMVSYEGGHRPDVMGALASALSGAGCHFTDVSLDASLGDHTNAFVLVCEVEAPLERDEIQALVDGVGKKAGITLSVIPSDMDDIASGIFEI